MRKTKIISLIVAAAVIMGVFIGCNPVKQPQDTETTEHTTTEKVTQTTNPEDEATRIPETTEFFTIEETTAENTKETVPYETVPVTDETTTDEHEEIEGDCSGVWRVEKVIVHMGPPEGSNAFSVDVSDQLLSIYIDENSIYMGSTDSIIQQYRRMGDVVFDEDEHGKTITISMFSLASGRSLTAEYHYSMKKDEWGTIKLHLDLKSLDGDPTKFGFDSIMNTHCGIEMSEWAFAKTDSEHDPDLFRSNDTVWYAEQPSLGRYKKLRFSYDEGFNVYDNNLIIGTWRTITRGQDKILIITDTDGYVTEGTYSVNSSEYNPILVIKWDDEEPESRYFVPVLEY